MIDTRTMPDNRTTTPASRTPLRERALAIESGKIQWVNHTPRTTFEGCVAYDYNITHRFKISPAFTDDAFKVLEQITYAMPGYGIDAWNDAHGRTKEEVVALLRRAADIMREPYE